MFVNKEVEARFNNEAWMKEVLNRSSIGLWNLSINMRTGKQQLYCNQKMLELIGLEEQIDPEECMAYFNSRIKEGHEEIVQKFIDQMIETRRAIEVQYIWKHPKWGDIFIRCSGKVEIQSGDTVMISGYHQNRTEIETLKREKLIQDKLLNNMQRQQLRYNTLFESVLCGIVQYKNLENGYVVFKNANREAMRILGYCDEKEFWNKKKWYFPSLIYEEDRDRIIDQLDQINNIGDTYSFEYRIAKKDGSYGWIIGSAEKIRDIDDEEIMQSVFIDINDKKRTEIENYMLSEQIQAGNELLSIALEHTNVYEFYYYPLLEEAYVPLRTSRAFKSSTIYKGNHFNQLTLHMDKEHLTAYMQMIEKVSCGSKTESLEYKSNDSEQWFKITLTAARYNEQHEVSLIIGIIEDITQQKQMEIALLEEKTKDRLTGIYTKTSGIHKIKEHMDQKEENQRCALLIIDLDDFKKINEEEGTVFADAVLQEVADIIRSETREHDIYLRLGGDEFMIYLKDCSRRKAVETGERINDRIQKMFACSNKKLEISASIGICTTQIVNDFTGLYRCAVSALQYVKEKEKGHVMSYLDTSNELGTMLTRVYPDDLVINDIDSNDTPVSNDIFSFSLELLGKAKNIDNAVNLLMARIGKQFNYDRVSIFEIDNDYQSLTCTYQWARDRRHQMIGRRLYYTKDNLDEIISRYDKEGLCESIPEDDDCAGRLRAAFWNQGAYAGTLTFEIYQRDYVWSSEEKKLIKEMAKIIYSYIMKVRADALSQAKTDFLSRMSHEIRTPMNAIMGMTAIAKSVIDDKSKVLDCLEKIDSANEYLIQIINDILDMSKIESGKTQLNEEATDIKKLLNEVESIMSPQAINKNIQLSFNNYYKENDIVIADSLRLNQVLVNIVGNAIKFTNDFGYIEVVVKPVYKDSQKVALKFSIHDNGIGISKEQINKIFKPFEQADRMTSRKYGGTGLGLSISSRLVQMMGGTLEVKSEVGHGSQFYFTVEFKLSEKKAAQYNHFDGVQEKIYNFEGTRALVVEDNEINREIAVTILEMNHFKVECAGNGREAVDKYIKNPPGYYDVILMDIQMPVMDGIKATQLIRTSQKDDAREIPIVAMTANAFDEDTRISMKNGMNGHLVKPIQIRKLLDTLDMLLKKDA